jgi:hypothetical protein
MIIKLRTLKRYLCVLLLCLAYSSVLGEELTAEQRAIADALVGKQIKEIQAEIIKSSELKKNIEAISLRQKDIHGKVQASDIGRCANQCRNSHVLIPLEINDKAVDDIIWQYENPSGYDTGLLKDHKHQCITALSLIGNKRAIPTIIMSLKNDSWDNDWPPVEVIADESFIAPIESYTALRHNQAFSIPAIKCLGAIGPKSISTLKQFLKEDDQAIRREAINALIKICDMQCIPVLEEVIALNNPEFTEKAQAGILLIRCRAIDKIYSPPKWNPEDDARLLYLTNLVLSDMDPNVRAQATEATLKIGDSTVWYLRLGLPNKAHAMRGSIDGPFYFVAERARDVLTLIGESSIPALIDALCDEYVYPQNRRFASQALQKITGETFGPDYEKWKSWYLQKYSPKDIQ